MFPLEKSDFRLWDQGEEGQQEAESASAQLSLSFYSEWLEPHPPPPLPSTIQQLQLELDPPHPALTDMHAGLSEPTCRI